MRVNIAGVNYNIVSDSLSVDKAVLEFSSCRFSIRVFKNNTTFFKEGQPLSIYDSLGAKIFSGVVWDVTESGATSSGGLTFAITAMGNEYYVYKRVVVKSYSNQVSGNIVRDILSTYLEEEGITAGVIEGGKIVKEIILNYVYANEALDKLAELNGFWWYVDQHKQLHFFKNEVFSSPFNLTFDVTIPGSTRVKKGNPKYRNIQLLVGCKGVTVEQTQVFKGDGTNTAFTLGYPVSKVVRIEVATDGGVPVQKTFDFKGLSDGANFSWGYDDPVLTHNDEIPLSESDELTVVYNGLYDLVVTSSNFASIHTKKGIEQGTGKVEHVKSDSSRGIENAIDVADALLELYATDGTTIDYRTFNSGLEPGMVQTVYLPNHNIFFEPYLITSVSASDTESDIEYSISLVKGPVGNDWVNFFVKADQESRIGKVTLGAGNSGVVMPVFTFTRTWDYVEPLKPFDDKLYPNDGVYPNDGKYTSFDEKTFLKYVAWFNASGVELGRTPIVNILAEENRIYSVAFIPASVTGVIAQVGWYAGGLATPEKGSGILLEKRNVEWTKTNLEVYQIERYDLKGW